METHALRLLQLTVKEHMHMVLRVVDESERGHGARSHAQIFHQSRFRGEAQLALMQLFLDVVDVHVLVAVEADQIVLVALVVAEEEVLAMDRAVVVPPALGLLDGLAFGMSVVGVGDVMFLEIE